MLIYRYKNAYQKIRTHNKSFKSVTENKYLENMATNQNCVHEEIKSRLNSGNACYNLIQNLPVSYLIMIKLKYVSYIKS
jgi:hypothetical protein